jgi:hypothetical protein
VGEALPGVVGDLTRTQFWQQVLGDRGPLGAVLQHRDEEVVHPGEQQGVEHQPHLAQRRVRVGGVHLGARQLEGEATTAFDLAEIRTHRGKADSVRFVYVVFAEVVVLGRDRLALHEPSST